MKASAKEKATMRARWHRLLAEKLCTICARNPRGRTQRCESCNKKMLDRHRRYRAAGKMNQRRGPNLPTGDEVMSYGEIARELGMTIDEVKRITSVAIAKLRLHCYRVGINERDVIGRPASMIARLEEWA